MSTRRTLAVVILGTVAFMASSCSRDPETASAQTPAGQVRNYFIAADEVTWDYAPSGKNQVSGEPFNPFEIFVALPGMGVIRIKYRKTIYREYAVATFTSLRQRPANCEHLGFLGPLIRAEVGYTIKVVFKSIGKLPFR